MSIDEELPPLNPIPPLGEDAAMRPWAAATAGEARPGVGPAAWPVAPPTPVANPYGPPLGGDDGIVTAGLLPEPANPRVWTALLGGILAIPLAGVVGGVMLVAAMFVSRGTEMFGTDATMTDWLEGFAQTRWGLLVLVVPGQLVFLGATVGAAWLPTISPPIAPVTARTARSPPGSSKE